MNEAHFALNIVFSLSFRKRGKKCDENLVAALEKAKLCEAGHEFLNALREVDDDKNTLISMEEFKAAFEKVNRSSLGHNTIHMSQFLQASVSCHQNSELET